MPSETSVELVKKNHPYMSDSLQQLISNNIDVFAGNMAVVILQCKTTGEIKRYCEALKKLGEEAEIRIAMDTARYNKVPVKQKGDVVSMKKRGKRGG